MISFYYFPSSVAGQPRRRRSDSPSIKAIGGVIRAVKQVNVAEQVKAEKKKKKKKERKKLGFFFRVFLKTYIHHIS